MADDVAELWEEGGANVIAEQGESWDEVEKAAAEGRWEDIGLDNPDDFQTATFDEFMEAVRNGG